MAWLTMSEEGAIEVADAMIGRKERSEERH